MRDLKFETRLGNWIISNGKKQFSTIMKEKNKCCPAKSQSKDEGMFGIQSISFVEMPSFDSIDENDNRWYSLKRNNESENTTISGVLTWENTQHYRDKWNKILESSEIEIHFLDKYFKNV